MNEVASLSLEGLVEDVEVKAVLYSLSTILPAQRVWHLVEVLERERKLLVLFGSLRQFGQISDRLTEHDSVVTLIGRLRTDVLEQLSEARVR